MERLPAGGQAGRRGRQPRFCFPVTDKRFPLFGDSTGDGTVDAADFRLLYANLEKNATPEQLQEIANFESTVAPEPGALTGALPLVGLMLFRRRRRH